MQFDYQYDIILNSDEMFWFTFFNHDGSPRDLTDCSGVFRARLETTSVGNYDVETEHYDIIADEGTVVFHIVSGHFDEEGRYLTEVELIQQDHTSKFYTNSIELRVKPQL